MYEIELDALPIGILADSSKKGDMTPVPAKMLFRALSDEPDFAHYMNIVTGIITQLPKDSGVWCSTVDHFLAVIWPDRKCKVYVNELGRFANVRAKSRTSLGEEASTDKILDVETTEFEGVKIPDDAGVIAVFSHGWRKALFFDLSPLHGDKEKRRCDLREEFGQCLNLLFFHHLHDITKHQMGVLFSQRWFPFTGLKHATIKSMLSYVDSGWHCDDLLDDIIAEVKAGLPEWIKSWESSAPFRDHMELIAHAAEKFMQDDYVASTSILYPKIEGVLRSIAPNLGTSKLKQAALSKIALEESGISAQTFSALLPREFSEYLEKVLFADFKSGETPPMSRNAVAHGIAPAEYFSAKESVIVLLTLHQIFYHRLKPA